MEEVLVCFEGRLLVLVHERGGGPIQLSLLFLVSTSAAETVSI